MFKKAQGTGFLLLLLSVAASRGQEHAQHQPEEELLARLESVLPNEPAVATAEHVQIMVRAGATKRLDAAVLLVRALAFNLDAGASNEKLSPLSMMPAAIVLQDQYGTQVIPLLMMEAVSTEKEWLQKRVALVVRSFKDQDEVAKAKEAFSLKESPNPKAKRFNSFLEQRQLDIEWANPALEDSKKFIENILKNKERKAKPPNGEGGGA